MDFFDSNVLIAASLAGHVHHRACDALLDRFGPGDAALAPHSLAETYNTLTKNSSYRVPPADAASIIESASKTYTLVALTAKETAKAIADAAAVRVVGPEIYDALLLACARKIDAKTIYTFNVRHFRQIAPDLVDRIVEPY